MATGEADALSSRFGIGSTSAGTVVHLHIDNETPHGWNAHHFVGQYRAVTTDELLRLADQAGLQRGCILPPNNTGFYQPIIVAEVG